MVDMSGTSGLVYGTCFQQIIHYAISLEMEYPTMRIVVLQVDATAAYQRLTHAFTMSLWPSTAIGNIGYMAIRLTFGSRINVYNTRGIIERDG